MKRAKGLKGRADTLFSIYIRRRDAFCRRCGTSQNLQCAHVWSRSYLAIRFDEENAMALCLGCHLYFGTHPIEWTRFVIEQIGAEKYEALQHKALTHERPDYPSLLAWLNSELKEPA